MLSSFIISKVGLMILSQVGIGYRYINDINNVVVPMPLEDHNHPNLAEGDWFTSGYFMVNALPYTMIMLVFILPYYDFC